MNAHTVETAEEIRSLLTDPQWRVRPTGNEIPAGLRGTLAGEVFARFARTSDSEDHVRRKQLVVELIASLETDEIPTLTQGIVRRLHPITPHDLQFLVPGMVVSALLGIPEQQQRTMVEQVRALVIGARADASDFEHAAAVDRMGWAVSLISESLGSAERTDLEVIASRISLVFQSSDACAAIVGNALMLLAEQPEYADLGGEPIVRKSMHERVSVRTTSRFRGQEAAVLNLEAAHRQEPNVWWTFGFGPHVCPGRSIAMAIADACIDAVVAQRPFDFTAVKRIGWENLPNVWIPILESETEGSK